jgi:hypothetical protein
MHEECFLARRIAVWDTGTVALRSIANFAKLYPDRQQ